MEEFYVSGQTPQEDGAQQRDTNSASARSLQANLSKQAGVSTGAVQALLKGDKETKLRTLDAVLSQVGLQVKHALCVRQN